MKRLGFTRIAISLPRLIFGAAIVGLVAGGAQLVPQPSHAQSLQPQNTASKKAAPYTPAPQTASQPAPAATPQVAVTTPKPITTVAVQHSTKAAPVVKPAASASVSGLTPTEPASTTSTSGSTGTGGSGTSGSTAPAPPATTTGYTSTNWSGYMATTGSYTAISGSWTVPAATGTAGRTSADAAWIGIGGVSTNDLIQVGTEDSVSGSGHETSTAFYELLPNVAQTITSLNVSPGDTITASLAEVSGSQWKITITDTTTGQSYATTVTYTSSNSSAEWIEEDPSTTHNRLVTLDTFAPVSFTGAAATSSGGGITLATGDAQPITMVTGSGSAVATPSALGSDGQSFTVTRDS